MAFWQGQAGAVTPLSWHVLCDHFHTWRKRHLLQMNEYPSPAVGASPGHCCVPHGFLDPNLTSDGGFSGFSCFSYSCMYSMDSLPHLPYWGMQCFTDWLLLITTAAEPLQSWADGHCCTWLAAIAAVGSSWKAPTPVLLWKSTSVPSVPLQSPAACEISIVWMLCWYFRLSFFFHDIFCFLSLFCCEVIVVWHYYFCGFSLSMLHKKKGKMFESVGYVSLRLWPWRECSAE